MRNKLKQNLILLPHCILTSFLNENLQRSNKELLEIMDILIDSETGILQLPCPHLISTIALKNQTLNNADTSTENMTSVSDSLPKLYQAILEPIVSQIEEYQRHGTRITGVIGVKGSPKCSLKLSLNKESIQFIKMLVTMLKEKGIIVPIADL